MGVTLKLEAKILEKRGDVFAILQLIKEEDPDILAKWETCQPSPSGADDDPAGGLGSNRIFSFFVIEFVRTSVNNFNQRMTKFYF